MHIKDTRRTIKLDDNAEVVNENYNNYDIIIKMNKGAIDNTNIIEESFVFRTKSPIPIIPNQFNLILLIM